MCTEPQFFSPTTPKSRLLSALFPCASYAYSIGGAKAIPTFDEFVSSLRSSVAAAVGGCCRRWWRHPRFLEAVGEKETRE